jgi:phosphoglycerol transferase
MLTSVDWAIIKILSVFTAEPGYLLNGFWLLTLVFSAWTAAYATYQLGLPRTLAFVSGVLYAFLPYALLRNVHHLSLVYYLVPLLCLLAVVIATGGAGVRNSRTATLVGLAACVLQGFNYIYYSFFAALLFSIAALLAYRPGHVRSLKLPLLALAVVTLSTTVNLLPALQSWNKEGKPPEMAYKSIAEVEIYGAKLRRMLAPHPDNPVPPLAFVARKAIDANFPNENENSTARLGLYGGLGLLLMIFFVLRQNRRTELSPPMAAVSGLGVAILLVITVGGLGAVINLLTVPDIRAYNRFSVYLGFFAIAASGLWLKDRFSAMLPRWRIAGYFIAGGFVLLSLYDQLLDARPLHEKQQEDVRRARDERMAVANLERVFPKGTAVLQLPFTGYPPLASFNHMASYDHARPYIWSNHLKWSWPSFSQRHRAWQDRLEAMQGGELIRAAVFSGFNAIWIDRAAYQDAGRNMLASLLLKHVKQVDIGSTRFAVLDIREAAAQLKAGMSDAEFAQHASKLLGSGAVLEWKRGFYADERNPQGQRYRWAENKAMLRLRNPGDAPLNLCLDFGIAAPAEGSVHIEGADQPLDVRTSAVPQPVRIALHLKPGEVRSLRFSTGLPRVNAPGDPRQLYFNVMEFALSADADNGNREASCSSR